MWLTVREYDGPGPSWVLDGQELDYFSAPALNPAYDFKVIVYCTMQTLRRYRIGWWQAKRQELHKVSEIIRDTIRQTARQFSIFQPGAAEQAINERLAKRLDGAERNNKAIISRWTARAEVALPEEILTLMRDAFNENYEIRENAKATALRMTETEGLREGWDRFLDDAAKSKNAQHAVQLAENPHNIAEVLEEVLTDRRKGAEDLVNLINKIVEVQRSADILDLVVQSETVLRKTLEMMGIQLPAMEADAMLAPLEGDI
jgi:hypothetical protein